MTCTWKTMQNMRLSGIFVELLFFFTHLENLQTLSGDVFMSEVSMFSSYLVKDAMSRECIYRRTRRPAVPHWNDLSAREAHPNRHGRQETSQIIIMLHQMPEKVVTNNYDTSTVNYNLHPKHVETMYIHLLGVVSVQESQVHFTTTRNTTHFCRLRRHVLKTPKAQFFSVSSYVQPSLHMFCRD